MQQATIIEQLKSCIAQDVLGGKDIGLDETTPLLEWGIINSLEIVRLLSFIRKQFGVDISANEITAESFASISSVAELVLAYMPARIA